MYSVILADDEPYILRGLEKKINWTDMGFEITGMATNGLECLEMAKVREPDLVITDIRMPGLNGLDLLEKLHDLDMKPVIIYISGYSEFEYAQRAIDLGALTYLLKPIEAQNLVRTLEKARERIELKREKFRSRSRRETDELLSFLQTSPPGIEERILLERIGLGGNYDTFLCAADEKTFPDDLPVQICGGQAEVRTLPAGGPLRIRIINLPGAMVRRFTEKLTASVQETSGTVGLSDPDQRIRQLGEMILQAQSAFHSDFITGEPGVYRESSGEKPVLTEIVRDFELMFSIGSENRLHQLIDQLRVICSRETPSMREVTNFYNSFIAMWNKYALLKGSHVHADPPVSDPARLAHRYGNIRSMIDHLHDITHTLFASTRTSPVIGREPAQSTAAVKEYIRKHPDEDLTAEHLAGIFHEEKSRLTARFKAETGKTLSEFVRQSRIDHACFLLEHTRLSIQEIADMCGFGDYFYFAKLFRREKGRTATEYRKQVSGDR